MHKKATFFIVAVIGLAPYFMPDRGEDFLWLKFDVKAKNDRKNVVRTFQKLRRLLAEQDAAQELLECFTSFGGAEMKITANQGCPSPRDASGAVWFVLPGRQVERPGGLSSCE